jgi:aldehyde dehydrogenase (NAD+)
MDVDKLFRLLQASRQRLKETTAAERIQKLDRIGRAILERLPELGEALYGDLRKPEPETVLSEAYPVLSEIRHARRNLQDWLKPQPVPSPLVLFNARSEIRYEPRGAVLIIAPWNFPFQLAVAPLVSALAAGNAVVVKPSELAPRTAAFTKRLLADLFDPNEVAVVEGDRRVAQSLVRLPFDHIFFTGGSRTGREIMATAAANLTSVTLELGGKSPAILHASSDIRDAAFKIIWGKCLNAGQGCVAPDYVLVPKDVEASFIDAAREAIEARYGPEGRIAENPDYGRILNIDHFRRVQKLVDDAVRAGATIEAGGTFREDRLFISPTLLRGIPEDADLLQEEIFGPVLPIVPYLACDDAVRFVNSRPRPLALYVFGKNESATEVFIKEIGAGTTVVNDVVVHFGSPYLPFGGFNHSGIGKSHGFFGFKAFSHERAILRQPKRSLARLLYPPYNRFTRKLIQLTARFF